MPDLSWPKIRKLLRAPGIGFNAEVYRYFKDDLDPKSVGGRTKVRDFCLIGAKDSRSTALSKIQYFRDQVQRIHEHGNAIATVPESWDRRVSADIPQLVIVFRPPGKKTSYQITIPHYNGSKQPQIPNYRKGSWRGELILKDNSRLVVNAFSGQEALNMIRALEKYIVRKMVDTKPTARQIRGEEFRDDKVIPVFADYYPEGKKYCKKALWRKRLS